MMEPRRMKVKVCLVGEHAVGKTSLIKRYVLNEYDDRYIVTLGAKVSKTDLKEQAAFGEEQVKQASEAFDAPYFFSSAKSGENVELLFRTLGETIAQTASKSAA